jgi:hypothetical protein
VNFITYGQSIAAEAGAVSENSTTCGEYAAIACLTAPQAVITATKSSTLKEVSQET